MRRAVRYTGSYETSVLVKATQCHIPEDHNYKYSTSSACVYALTVLWNRRELVTRARACVCILLPLKARIVCVSRTYLVSGTWDKCLGVQGGCRWDDAYFFLFSAVSSKGVLKCYVIHSNHICPEDGGNKFLRNGWIPLLHSLELLQLHIWLWNSSGWEAGSSWASQTNPYIAMC